MSKEEEERKPHAASPTAIPPRICKDRALVHRILLTDPSRLDTLTLSGQPRMLHTPTFDEFNASLARHESVNSSDNLTAPPAVASAVDLNALVKGAFRDQVCERICKNRNLAPAAHDLLLELHGTLRMLIPSRRDLHKLLDDSVVTKTESVAGVLSLTIQAAQALEALESQARAVSTNAWIQTARRKVDNAEKATAAEEDEFNPDAISYLVSSILYLLFKAELCQMDKNDFYLSHVWAPQIIQKGPEMERANFETEFGSLAANDDSTTAPATRTWIHMLVKKASEKHDGSLEGLTRSADERRNLVRMGWVETILFHSSPPPSGPAENKKKDLLLLPEIFALDQGSIQAIRKVTRLAAAGSALALHACQMAGQATSVLNQALEPSSSSSLDLRRAALVQAMSEQWKTQEAYEQDVTAAVVALAEEWKSSPLDPEAKETLSGRTHSVLQAQDPVLQLLDGRMKECFQQAVILLAQSSLTAPTTLRTGRSTAAGGPVETRVSTASSSQNTATATLNTKRIRDLFCSRGLSFYANELTVAAQRAFQIVELALDVYGGHDVFLDRIIQKECSGSTK